MTQPDPDPDPKIQALIDRFIADEIPVVTGGTKSSRRQRATRGVKPARPPRSTRIKRTPGVAWNEQDDPHGKFFGRR
jgi:hypothetical protein